MGVIKRYVVLKNIVVFSYVRSLCVGNLPFLNYYLTDRPHPADNNITGPNQMQRIRFELITLVGNDIRISRAVLALHGDHPNSNLRNKVERPR